MGNFAKVVDGKVVDVIVAEPDYFNTFVDTSPGTWIQTSYNTRGGIYYTPNTNPPVPDPDQSKALRKNYAGIGFSYYESIDAFVPPQPYPSWDLNTTTGLWQAPIPMPEDGQLYIWDEQQLNWVLYQG